MSFSGEVERFANKSLVEADQDRRAIILKLFSSVIKDTPVDSGRARNNWLTSVGSPASGSPNANNKSGSDATNGIKGNLGKLTDAVYLTNNVEYIGHLEYGTPKFSPFAMVRKNMIRITALMKGRGRFT
jgi:hypothetical protein